MQKLSFQTPTLAAGCARLVPGQHLRGATRNKSRAFTLIELLITVSVVSIALGLTGPSLAGLAANMRSYAALQGIVSTLSLARQEAMLRRQQVTVCAVAPDGSCSRDWRSEHEITVFIDSDKDGKPGIGELILRQTRWSLRDSELSWRASLARRYLRFEATGGTWQNGTLYYCPASGDIRHARSLVISHSGRAYLPGDSNGDGIREDRRGVNLSC
ncbi:MAG: GspH/FimT family protein [Pseudomonadota bacterium]